MTQEAKFFGLSLGLHLVVMLCLIMAATRSIERPPKTIMVVLDNFVVPEMPRSHRRTEQAVDRVRPAPAPVPSIPAPSHQAPYPLPVAVPQMPAPPVTAPLRENLKSVPETVQADTVNRQRTDVPVSAAAHPRTPAPHQAPAAEPAPSTERLQQRYLKEHFVYIRDLITKQLVYPPTARRMGWNGKTVLSFVVAEDGSVHNLRVLESSGHQILDKSAAETVRITAPFPKPPVRAEIVVPINFRML